MHYHNQQIYHTLRDGIQELEKSIVALAEYLRKFKEKLTRLTDARISDDLKREAKERVQQYHKVREAIEKIEAPVHHVVLTFFPDRTAPKYEPYPS